MGPNPGTAKAGVPRRACDYAALASDGIDARRTQADREWRAGGRACVARLSQHADRLLYPPLPHVRQAEELIALVGVKLE